MQIAVAFLSEVVHFLLFVYCAFDGSSFSNYLNRQDQQPSLLKILMSFRKPVLLNHSLTKASELKVYFFNLTLLVEVPGKVQIPHPGKPFLIKFPNPLAPKVVKCPGLCPGRREGEMDVEH